MSHPFKYTAGTYRNRHTGMFASELCYLPLMYVLYLFTAYQLFEWCTGRAAVPMGGLKDN